MLKVVLPPLADRREDIPLPVDHFIRKFRVQQGKQIEDVSEEAELSASTFCTLSDELPSNRLLFRVCNPVGSQRIWSQL